MRVFVVATLVASLDVTPVQKVIQLLEGMAEKGKQEKHEEQVQFAKYKQFCDDVTVEKHDAIKEANHKMEQLTASIQKAEADAATLAKEITEHDADISRWEGDKKAATEVREKENADYVVTHKDYSESIDALARAVEVLKKQTHDRKQVLAQVTQMTLIPEHAKKVITAFLAQGDELGEDAMAVSAPEANAYEFQSQGVIDMMEKLHDKFEDERTDLENTEKNAQHAYEMVAADLTGQMKTSTEDREFKAREKASKMSSAASDKDELAETTATRDSDQTFVDDLEAECKIKSSDFENRQQLRADEIEAIQKATEIMSSDSVSGSADKHLPALVQKVSFMQISAVVNHPTQKKVAEFLREQGKSINSRVLVALAVRVAEDPFVKVKTMIKDLIVRLMEEANEEAEHKGWCDAELSENEQTRSEKTTQVTTLTAEIDELNASIAKLGQEITDLEKALAELDANVAEATAVRNEEHAENTQTIADSKAAQTAVAQATKVLKDFYEKAADATSLVQQQPERPEVFDTPYKGMQSENGGVVGMLEVIASDFNRLESDTKQAETESQNAHDAFLSASAQNKAQMTADVEHKTGKRTSEQSTMTAKKGDLEGTQEELDSALAYYDKLKPSCVDAGVSYEDRVTRRKEEIQSLQEALRIFGGEEIAFLQK